MPISSSIPSSGTPVAPVLRFSRFSRLRLAPRLAAAALALAVVAPSVQAQASDMYLGQLMLVGYNFCPRGWATAEGQLLSIAQNTALFSLLGTQFGGNGQTTFALPDLRGRAPIGQGQGPGLSRVEIGEVSGAENVTLIQSQMPAHTHGLIASTQPATLATPDVSTVLAQTMNAGGYGASNTANVVMAGNSIGVSGGSQPFSIRNPYLGMTWCIAIYGVYPPRP